MWKKKTCCFPPLCKGGIAKRKKVKAQCVTVAGMRYERDGAEAETEAAADDGNADAELVGEGEAEVLKDAGGRKHLVFA